jgi:UDP-N-acetylmuramyl pentapeptide phosphotransferase/UDP-N-acetylglucosamine-1-phosphate transferase
MGWIQVTGVALGIFTFSAIFIYGLRAWAERKKIFDIPNERSSHKYPTPRGGGLAIVISSVIGIWLLFPVTESKIQPSALFAFTFSAILISAVSWMDDIRSMPNRIRFALHSLGAVIIIMVFGYFQVLAVPLLGEIHIGWLGLFVTFIWIVGLTNAYNFMDGIDGIAGGQAVIAGIGWFILAVAFGDQLIAIFSILIIFSSLGFLLHNWAPAKIFMGDVGSAFLGFTFASVPLIIDSSNSFLPILSGLLVWPFIFDTSYTFLRRLRNRENVFEAHRSHLYQRLVIAGLPHNRVTVIYFVYGVIGLFTAYSIVKDNYPLTIIGFLLIVLSILALVNVTVRHERFPDNPVTNIQ